MSNETKMSADGVLAAVRIELCAAMRDGDDPWDHVEKHPVVKRFDAAVAALIAERDALREKVGLFADDAERYRWLRKFSANSAPDYVAVPTLVWAGRYDDRWLFKLDAAVDAARANEST